MKVIIVGILLIVAGIFTLVMGSNKKRRCTVAVPGRIIDVLKEQEADERGHSWVYYPVYEYWTGYQMIRKRGNIGRNSKHAYKIGQTAMIRFNPQRPDEFTINGKTGTGFFGVSLILLGIILIIAILSNGLSF